MFRWGGLAHVLGPNNVGGNRPQRRYLPRNEVSRSGVARHVVSLFHMTVGTAGKQPPPQDEFWFNLKTGRVESGLLTPAPDRVGPFQSYTEAEQALEQLDIELGQVQESHEDGQTVYLEREAELNRARERTRELELAAQQAEFAQRAHETRIEELKRNIATALEQSAQLFASMEQGTLELEQLDDQAAQAGLEGLSVMHTAPRCSGR